MREEMQVRIIELIDDGATIESSSDLRERLLKIQRKLKVFMTAY